MRTRDRIRRWWGPCALVVVATLMVTIPAAAQGCDDIDNDGVCDTDDNCPATANPEQADTDADGVGDVCDNCVVDANPEQRDCDADGIGDVCDPEPCGTEPPIGTPRLGFGATDELVWSALDTATAYDVVLGNLGLLRRSEGDFTEATRECLADDLEALSLVFDPRPEVDGGFWFLVRGVNPAGPGTYNVGPDSQVADRDEEIAAAAGACP